MTIHGAHAGSACSTAAARMTAAAAVLRDARVSGRPMTGATARSFALSMTEAYAVQAIDATARASASRPVGYKLALTSPGVQARFGATEPTTGRLFADMRLDNGASLANMGSGNSAVEVEFAFVLRDDLAAAGCTPDDVIAATAVVLPALEIADCRVADWDVSLPVFIADNSAGGWFVLGDEPLGDASSLAAQETEIFVDGEHVATGRGADVLGNPVEAVAWLARTLHARGERLRGGDVVLSGSTAAPLLWRSGERVAAVFAQGQTLAVSR